MESVQKTKAGNIDSVTDFGFTVVYPFALRAAIVLKVPTIIQSAGPEAALSAKEICALLPNPERCNSATLEKILEILTCHGMLSSAFTETETETGRVKKYALTSLSQDLAGDNSSAADSVLFFTAPEMIKIWPQIHEAVLNPDGALFEKVYGKGFYQYTKEDVPEYAKFHVEVMQRMSRTFTEAVLEYYDEEFKSLPGTLVDVGGSQGATAAIIASKYPNMKCVINFDLPDVVSGAPAYRGVEHVGGSFLDFVPQADMLFLKFVLLNWNDEQLVKLMTNCFNALPAKGGKVIIVDRLMPDEAPEDTPTRLRMAVQSLLNTLVFPGAKSRKLKEHQVVAKAAGFASFRVAKSIDTLTFMEAVKAPIVG